MRETLEERFIESLTNDILAARFLLGTMVGGTRNLAALRDKYPSEFSQLTMLLEADKTPIFWWIDDTIFHPDTATFMISQNAILRQQNPFDRAGNLLFPDDTKLSLPGPDFLVDDVQKQKD